VGNERALFGLFARSLEWVARGTQIRREGNAPPRGDLRHAVHEIGDVSPERCSKSASERHTAPRWIRTNGSCSLIAVGSRSMTSAS